MTIHTIQIGQPLVVESSAPAGPFATVFEDDGETGYFYAIDPRKSDQSTLDGVMVYQGPTPDHESKSLRIAWSADGRRAVLFLDDDPQAAFDFDQHRGFCRSNFPPSSQWSAAGHAWDDSVLRGLGPAA